MYFVRTLFSNTERWSLFHIHKSSLLKLLSQMGTTNNTFSLLRANSANCTTSENLYMFDSMSKYSENAACHKSVSGNKRNAAFTELTPISVALRNMLDSIYVQLDKVIFIWWYKFSLQSFDLHSVHSATPWLFYSKLTRIVPRQMCLNLP